MNEQSEHLSNAQIESYGERTSAAADDQLNEDQRVEAHLEDCQSCRGRVLNFHRAHFGLLKDSVLPTSSSADLKIGSTKPGNQAVNSGRMAPASGNRQPHGGMQPPATQDVQAHAGLNTLDSGQRTAQTVNTVATPDCPSADELRRLAADLLEPAEAKKLNRHIVACNHCGPLLQAYIEDFSDDFSPEEQAVLAQLQSSSEDWQKQAARKMLNAALETAETATVKTTTETSAAEMAAEIGPAKVGTAETNAVSPQMAKVNVPVAGKAVVTDLSNGSAVAGRPKPAKPLFWKWLPIPATAALTAAVFLIVALSGTGVWYTRRETPEKVEKLLVQASMENRTTEMRWPEAAYSTLKSKRGGSSTPNLALLEAHQIVNQHQGQPQWALNAAGVALLQQHPDSAIQLLSPLTARSACDRCLLILAIANVAEGDSTGSKTNYESALQLINSIPLNSSEHNVAVYNRAIIYEKLGQSDAAIADWQTILKIEKDNGWLSEARQRLEDLLANQPK